MKEAFRLLNKSIIRVETPDVNLDQDEEAQMEVDEAPDGINGEMLVYDCSGVRDQNVLWGVMMKVHLLMVLNGYWVVINSL